MSQFVLSPSDDVRSEATWRPAGPIPTGLRAFAKYPNVQDWKPGDLLLVSSIEPDLAAKQIIEAQVRGGFIPDDARWQHAAVYLGDGYVIEATLHGVQYVPIFPYLGTHRLRLRRPLGLSDEDRWRIAIQAAVRANERYGVRSIFRLYLQSFRGLWRTKVSALKAQSRSIICSQLYSDSYSTITGRLLTRTIAVTITPAALSQSDAFEDVPLFWMTIPE